MQLKMFFVTLVLSVANVHQKYYLAKVDKGTAQKNKPKVGRGNYAMTNSKLIKYKGRRVLYH